MIKLFFKRPFSLFNLVRSYYEVLMSKYAFYCYYVTFHNLELSTFCNNLISLIVSSILIKLVFLNYFLNCSF